MQKKKLLLHNTALKYICSSGTVELYGMYNLNFNKHCQIVFHISQDS